MEAMMAKKLNAEYFLLDTHLLMWGAFSPERLSRKAKKVLDEDPELFAFSVVSLWEITIKRGLNRPDFRFDPQILRAQLLQRGMRELEVTAAHAMAVGKLPALHRDPFDRLLISQAVVENLTFVTSDVLLANYSSPVRLL